MSNHTHALCRDDIAERLLAAGLMHGDRELPAALAHFKPDSMLDSRYRLIVDAAVKLMKEGDAVNESSIFEKLMNECQTGAFKRADGSGASEFFMELKAEAFTDSNIVQYAKRIQLAAVYRTLQIVGMEMLRNAEERAGSPNGLAAEAIEKLSAVLETAVSRKPVSGADVIVNTVNYIAAQKRDPAGLETGLTDLDDGVRLRPGSLNILAARPGTGKTALALQIAYHVAQNRGVLFFSLEQPENEIGQRMLAQNTSVTMYELDKCEVPPEWEQTYNELLNHDLLRFDFDSHDFLEIGVKTRSTAARVNLGLVVVDFLQLIEPEDRKPDRREQIAIITRQLKRLATGLKVPILCLCQLNRESEKRGDNQPRLSELAESSAIEQNADTVLLLYRPDPKDKTTMKLDVAKNRQGETGYIDLRFIPEHVRFETPQPDWGHADPSDGF